MDGSRVAVIIPALNEARTVTAVVMAVTPFGTPVVVDDGSSDNTAELAAAAGAQVVRLPVNLGYDGALDAGFAHAAAQGFDYFVTVDADGQHNPAQITRFVQGLEAGAVVVAGVRDRRQRLGEHVFAWAGGLLWGLHDPLCGMKAYRASVYRALGHFDSYQSIGTELCLYAVKSGLQVSELPVATSDRLDAPRFGRRWAANRKIFRALALALTYRPGRRGA